MRGYQGRLGAASNEKFQAKQSRPSGLRTGGEPASGKGGAYA